MRSYRHVLGALVVLVSITHAGLARGQGYGTDLQNVMGPASGGMAGVSIARPQDVPSAIFGNPATLAQFEGTQFTLGGGWIEGYPTVTNDGSLNQLSPGTPFSATSRTQGSRRHRDRRGPGSAVASGWPARWAWASPVSAAAGAEYRGAVPGKPASFSTTSAMKHTCRAGHQHGGRLPGRPIDFPWGRP